MFTIIYCNIHLKEWGSMWGKNEWYNLYCDMQNIINDMYKNLFEDFSSFFFFIYGYSNSMVFTSIDL